MSSMNTRPRRLSRSIYDQLALKQQQTTSRQDLITRLERSISPLREEEDYPAESRENHHSYTNRDLLPVVSQHSSSSMSVLAQPTALQLTLDWLSLLAPHIPSSGEGQASTTVSPVTVAALRATFLRLQAELADSAFTRPTPDCPPSPLMIGRRSMLSRLWDSPTSSPSQGLDVIDVSIADESSFEGSTVTVSDDETDRMYMFGTDTPSSRTQGGTESSSSLMTVLY